MIERCRSCGSFMADGSCPDCTRKDLHQARLSCPSVALPDDVEVSNVMVMGSTINPNIRMLSLVEAVAAQLITLDREGGRQIVYLRSSRVKLILKVGEA